MTTWRELLDEATERLGSKTDARRIVERASGNDGADFWTGLDDAVTTRAVAFFDSMVERRATGEPLQYVLGSWGFRSLDLYVDRRVLIPRPETEQVVEVALAELRRLEAPKPLVVDLGTGSGAIALAIASEVPTAKVWATDASADALAVARANLAGIGRAGARVRLEHGDWFDALPGLVQGRVDLVVSNPPYVADDDELPGEVADWEPAAALKSGPTGLEHVTLILEAAPLWLTRPAGVVLEIAPHQASEATRIAHDAGFTDVVVEPDLAGRARALVARI
ncbi:MAG TPA: peptide chain release factor N(5)-glutamine methyltransferase [Acidimicrobiales bacterium]|nr:peptide chain release factor N(5)-glutamine methyltransferase [Acidimicrobiales bacterium]